MLRNIGVLFLESVRVLVSGKRLGGFPQFGRHSAETDSHSVWRLEDCGLCHVGRLHVHARALLCSTRSRRNWPLARAQSDLNLSGQFCLLYNGLQVYVRVLIILFLLN
jgi:hypothetical protein